MTGYVIFAHGSSVESANEAVRSVAAQAAALGGMEKYETAFLDGGRPLLPEAIARLAQQGIRDIVVIPYFLTPGLHLKRDLPELIRTVQANQPNLKIRVAPSLDGHPALGAILAERALEAE